MLMKAAMLKELRSLMRGSNAFLEKSIQAYIIPSSDAHGSEYLCKCDSRREFITGFDGSAGTAVVTDTHALLWTDSRYYQQASKQLDPAHWTLMKDGTADVPSIDDWLSTNLIVDSVVGVDASLISAHRWQTLESKLCFTGHKLLDIKENLIDCIWGSERTNRTSNPLFAMPIEHSGASIAEKLTRTRADMEKNKCDTLIITDLDEIAYLLNLRGSDIEYNTVFFSYCLIEMNALHLFVNKQQFDTGIVSQVISQGVDIDLVDQLHIHDYDYIWHHLAHNFVQQPHRRVWMSPACNARIFNTFAPDQRHLSHTPLSRMKVVKNRAERRGMREAHVRDSVAVCRFLHWMETRMSERAVLTERLVADKMDQLRAEMKDFVACSFATISAYGANASIVHYNCRHGDRSQSSGAAQTIGVDSIYLIDSGAHYLDGTTDVTRSVHFGTPTAHQRECFTRVLQGHIALCRCVCPSGILGSRIDALARVPLWNLGLDYGHGTGHGVGHCLCVHEGPCGIHSRPSHGFEIGLQDGMFLSDEPGYYEAGNFGIRIESVVEVFDVDAARLSAGSNGGFITFLPVTLVPIQLALIDRQLLTDAEIGWINDYHAHCLQVVGDRLLEYNYVDVFEWLKRNTTPL